MCVLVWLFSSLSFHTNTQAKSEDRERLVLRWRRMGATAVAIEQLDQGHFDSLCEVLVWLTQHTPKNDTVKLHLV